MADFDDRRAADVLRRAGHRQHDLEELIAADLARLPDGALLALSQRVSGLSGTNSWWAEYRARDTVGRLIGAEHERRRAAREAADV